MTERIPGPAYTLLTPRLVVRCWEPTDAPAFMETLASSREHLLPWLPWIRDEPLPLDDQVKRMRSLRAAFDAGQTFIYGIFAREGGRLLGGVGSSIPVGADAREVGGWVAVEAAGQGYATEAGAAVVRAAFEVDGLRRVEMHCDPRNEASMKVPRRLGFVHEATLRARDLLQDGSPSDSAVWSLFAEDYPASPCAPQAVEAYDAIGRRLL